MAEFWTIDNTDKSEKHTITGKGFVLEIQRLKNKGNDKGNNEEKISVAAYEGEIKDSELLGKIQISPADMEAGLMTLNRYGVMLSRPDCMDLARCIKENYYSLEPISAYDGYVIDDDTWQDILGLLDSIISAGDIQAITLKPRHELNSCKVYAIPVKTFGEELLQSQLSKITPKAIQEYLFQKGYTLVNRGCLDYVAPVGADKVKKKCVCLYQEKFDAAIKGAAKEAEA
ncbi:hypothetical protein ACTQ33_04165 [Candidatus Avoscillospira sp. LCP25S3_F1]|uniref:hypothetical protein n=1 Tax=Candidatus Avoscillospira sp. LCP25S3_F1 TaxID=3438825 RepID=UPI003F926950